MYEVWGVLFGHTLVTLGAHFLLYGLLMVFFDAPGGWPWDKIAAGFLVVAGLGLGGAASGWLGGFFHDSASSVLSATDKFLGGAVGASVGGVVIGVLLLWIYIRIRGKGIGAKTKFRTLALAMLLVYGGTVLSVVPHVFDTGDTVVRKLTGSREA